MAKAGPSEPSIRDVRPEDLRSTDRLMALYEQACDVGLAKRGEAGRMDFLSFAARARARGSRPGALLVWLLREQKTSFITLSDEEEGARRLRSYLNGPDERSGCGGGVGQVRRLSEEELVVERCILAAKQLRLEDPYRVAREVKGWTREEWDAARWQYERAQAQQWGKI